MRVRSSLLITYYMMQHARGTTVVIEASTPARVLQTMAH